MVHIGPEHEGTANESKDEARGDGGDEDFESEHVAAPDALRGPRTVMVQVLNTVVAEAAMLRFDVLARDDFAVLAELALAITSKQKLVDVQRVCIDSASLAFAPAFDLLNGLDFVQVALGVHVGVPRRQALVAQYRCQKGAIVDQ